ncbi:MAG TPA: hypothetical protein VHZ55_00280 [Bryobacteraceae bacterium]|nr:hypothetical protein [Bryobacteraceae bacterium]
MSSYISSNANRFYVALEAAYGQAAAITAANRFPAVRLQAHQSLEIGKRLDKTGTRTFLGASSSSRRTTSFDVQTYLTSWSGMGTPGYGPLFQAALGAAPTMSMALVVAGVDGTAQFQTTTAHGLSFGMAISYSSEIRFVTSVIDAQTILVNAPFTTTPTAGASLIPALTYSLANTLPSITLYDFWDPITTVSRVITGAAVDAMTFSLNGDFHEFTFSGPAGDLLDSSSFAAGSAGLTNYPAEPSRASFDYSIVPGHLGQVWLGGPANQFFTMTSASLEVKNNIQTRNEEFGSSYPRAIAAANREVISKFSLLAQDDAQTIALYAAAKQRTSLPAMLQLGQQQGHLMGVYLPATVPEIPVFNDVGPRLQWDFLNNLAQGESNDEIFVAFA